MCFTMMKETALAPFTLAHPVYLADDLNYRDFVIQLCM